MLRRKKSEQAQEVDNYLINKRSNARKIKRFTTQKHRTFLLAVFLGMIFITSLYFVSPVSNVYKVTVSGNHYFDDQFYRDLSGITDDSKYLLTISFLAENKLESDPLVEEATVIHEDHSLISIVIKEKEVVAYTYDSEPYLILKDGEKVAFEERYLEILSYIPFLEGYSDDDIKIITKGFEKLDQDMINEISEIHRYPFSYDDKMMEVIMRDGNYVYLSYYALPLLNNYHAIVSELKEPNKTNCIFVDEMSSSAYTSDCPFWTAEPSENSQNSTAESNDTAPLPQ